MKSSYVRSSSRFAGRLAKALVALALIPSLYAEPADSSVVNAALAPVVVTATRVPTLAEETAAGVTVITRADLEQAQIGDALSALKTVPGLSIVDGGMPGQTAGIFLRGTESRHTVILIDGHRLPTGLQRYFDLGYFPLGNISRIEVVRGPLGSTQGGGAIGGAINFISEHGAAKGVGGSVAGEYGSFSTRSAELNMTAAEEPVYANVSASHLTTDNRRPNSKFTSTSTLNTVGWTISSLAKLEVMGGYLHRDGGNPGPGTQTTAADPDESLEQNLWFMSPSLTLKTGEEWTHHVGFSYAHQSSYASRTQFFSDNTTTVKSTGLTWQTEYRPGDKITVQAGAERNEQDADYTPTGGNLALPFARTERSESCFAGAQVQPISGLTVLGSLRRDEYDAFYGAATTWRYGASYRISATGTVLHASDGTAFAAPEIQNFVDFGFGPLSTTLNPERSRGQEVGFTQELAGGRWQFGATAFQSKTTDLVQFDFLSFTAKNIGLARMRGVETFGEWRFSTTGVLRVGYTYLDARDEISGLPLQRRPRHTFSVEAHEELLTGWTLGFGIRGVADREDTDPSTFIRSQLPGYVVVRGFTQYEASKNLRLKLRIENLLNKQYVETAGYPALPLGLYGGVEWRF